MKPETSKEWELALSYFTKAEELLRDENFQDAEQQATMAILFAARAMIALSEELEMSELSVKGNNVFNEWVERIPAFKGKRYTPKEHIEWCRSVLKRLSDELPPDTFPPFRG